MDFFDLLQVLGSSVFAIWVFYELVHLIKTRSCEDAMIKAYLALFVAFAMTECYVVNLVLQHEVGLILLITISVDTILTLLLCLIAAIVYKNEI